MGDSRTSSVPSIDDGASRVVKRAFQTALLGLWAAGCSGGAAHVPDDPDAAAVALCDGSPGVRFIFRNVGGGPGLPGSEVLYENGEPYLIIDGDCSFWAAKDLLQDVRSGTLSDAQADAFSSALRLSEWDQLKGQYYDTLCDGPNRQYRFGADEVMVWATCGSGSSESSQPVDWMLDASLSQLSAIYDAGTPVGGPVRFVLMAEQPEALWPSDVTSRAAAWPLAADPAAIAISFDQANAYQPGSSLSADPPDADALRSIRRAFVGGGGAIYSGGFIPVVDAANHQYEFFVRDSIPLEDATGLFALE